MNAVDPKGLLKLRVNGFAHGLHAAALHAARFHDEGRFQGQRFFQAFRPVEQGEGHAQDDGGNAVEFQGFQAVAQLVQAFKEEARFLGGGLLHKVFGHGDKGGSFALHVARKQTKPGVLIDRAIKMLKAGLRVAQIGIGGGHVVLRRRLARGAAGGVDNLCIELPRLDRMRFKRFNRQEGNVVQGLNGLLPREIDP